MTLDNVSLNTLEHRWEKWQPDILERIAYLENKGIEPPYDIEFLQAEELLKARKENNAPA